MQEWPGYLTSCRGGCQGRLRGEAASPAPRPDSVSLAALDISGRPRSPYLKIPPTRGPWQVVTSLGYSITYSRFVFVFSVPQKQPGRQHEAARGKKHLLDYCDSSPTTIHHMQQARVSASVLPHSIPIHIPSNPKSDVRRNNVTLLSCVDADRPTADNYAFPGPSIPCCLRVSGG